ncbi:MAG: NOP5/NOP56 family protein [Candidatus Nanohaloarchaea archaeon]|nr:NOP5/NOP56 family protein [Candidatus Nanohaloarchaea archaeon]
MHRLAKNVLGVFILVQEDTLIDWTAFPDDPEAIATRMNTTCDEEQELTDKYEAPEKIQYNAFQLGSEAGIIDTREELHQRQVKVAQAYTRERIAESQNRDQLLVQATRAIDDLDEIKNELIERLRAWYSIHLPELDREIDDHQDFADMVADTSNRSDLMDQIGIDSTTGMDIDDTDRDAIQQFATLTQQSQDARDEIETYVSNLAEKIAPNVSAVLGKMLAARMIALAGSLEDLAKMPSSTIQVLGAEKALFRHMSGEGSAPKHGILFMHPHVRNLPDSKRGKMARFIANKTSIAARLDHFNGDFKGDKLRQEIDDKFDEVQA